MKSLLRQAAKRALGAVGLDIVRVRPDEKLKLLGLRERGLKTILDVGANSGQFAAQALTAFPGARIHSFEPQPDVFRELRAWCDREGRGLVTPHNVALGEREGTVEMWAHTDFNLASSLLKSTEAAHERWPATRRQSAVAVELVTLDAFVARERLDLPDLLVKLDVQGYEDRVIAGGAETLRRAKAVILEVNIDPIYEAQAAFRDLFLALDALGHRYAGNLEQMCAADGHVIYLDAVFVKDAAR